MWKFTRKVIPEMSTPDFTTTSMGTGAGWYHDNPASGRVLEKLGFKPVGEKEQPCLARGCTLPCHRVELDRAAYMTRKMGA